MTEILILASITLLAAISPGPDMMVVVKNAMKSSALGYMTALGVGLAVFVHVAYCIAGIGLIISQSLLLFSIIKVLGALYLLYISFQLFRSGRGEAQKIISGKEQRLLMSLREGFLTNVMNPKATIFFLSVFTQVIDPTTSILTQVFYGTMMATIVAVWFIILTTIMNIRYIKSHISSIQYYLNKVMWVLLAGIGVKILLTSSK